MATSNDEKKSLETFLAECNEKFSDRYSSKDSEYARMNKSVAEGGCPPPVVPPQQRQQQDHHHGGGRSRQDEWQRRRH